MIEPTTRMRLKPPYFEVVDRGGYFATRIADDNPIGRATAQPFVNGDAGLTWELFNCIKWLRRGEVEATAGYLQRLGVELGRRADGQQRKSNA